MIPIRKKVVVLWFISLVLVAALLNKPQAISGEFYISIGDYFEYSVNKAKVNFTLGNNTFSGSGINIANSNVPVGSIFGVNVTSVDAISSGFYYSFNETSMFAVINEYQIISIIPAAIMYTLSILQTIMNGGIEASHYYENGFKMHYSPTFIPYAPISQNFWNELDTFWSEFVSSANGDSASVSGDYSRTQIGEIILLEWKNTIEIYDNSESNPVYVTINNHYLLAIDPNTGVYKGTRFEGSLSGLVNNSATNIIVSQEFEQVGYNLPAFSLGLSLRIDSILFIAIPIVSLFWIGLKRRKRRN